MRIKLSSLAGFMLSSVGGNNLPSFGLKNLEIVLLACAARRCGMSDMLMEGGYLND